MILLALWSATSGFTEQRKLQGRTQASPSKSPPLTRWRTGHIVRLLEGHCDRTLGAGLVRVPRPALDCRCNIRACNSAVTDLEAK